MAAEKNALRFYVDESVMRLGHALEAARKDVVYCGHALIPECPKGVKDPAWMEAVASRDLIALGRDKHIRTRPGEREVLHEAGVKVVRPLAEKFETVGLPVRAGSLVSPVSYATGSSQRASVKTRTSPSLRRSRCGCAYEEGARRKTSTGMSTR